jgi:hypothetical protein
VEAALGGFDYANLRLLAVAASDIIYRRTIRPQDYP